MLLFEYMKFAHNDRRRGYETSIMYLKPSKIILFLHVRKIYVAFYKDSQKKPVESRHFFN